MSVVHVTQLPGVRDQMQEAPEQTDSVHVKILSRSASSFEKTVFNVKGLI